jgi:hypothetical protein
VSATTSQKCHQRGLMHGSKLYLYSITLSANCYGFIGIIQSYFNSNSTNSTRVAPTLRNVRIAPGSCQVKSPSLRIISWSGCSG